MRKFFIIISIFFFSEIIFAQRVLSVDSVYSLSDSLKNIIKTDESIDITVSNNNYFGFDIHVTENGFGLGGQYRTDDLLSLTTYFTFSINESKDDKEVEYIDYWGQSFVPGKINRFLVLPLFANVEQRLFRGKIANNLRPFVTAGFGPVLVYSSPYDVEIFSSLKKGKSHYVFGSIFGGGVNFGNEETGFTGFNVKYSIINLKEGIPSIKSLNDEILKKSKFGGFMISLTFAKVFK